MAGVLHEGLVGFREGMSVTELMLSGPGNFAEGGGRKVAGI